MKEPLEKVLNFLGGGKPVLVSKKKWMKVKTARRFLARNTHKIVTSKINWEISLGTQHENSFFSRVMKARQVVEQDRKAGGL